MPYLTQTLMPTHLSQVTTTCPKQFQAPPSPTLAHHTKVGCVLPENRTLSLGDLVRAARSVMRATMFNGSRRLQCVSLKTGAAGALRVKQDWRDVL